MEIIGYYESERQNHWLREIGRSDWVAGVFLHRILSEDTFFQNVGEGSDVLLLTDGDDLISFCTFSKKDCIQPTDLEPWIGFVYTFPKYRGHRFAGLLFDAAEERAKAKNIPELYLATDHEGLYEKYGFEYLTDMKDTGGNMSRVYVKKIK